MIEFVGDHVNQSIINVFAKSDMNILIDTNIALYLFGGNEQITGVLDGQACYMGIRSSVQTRIFTSGGIDLMAYNEN